MHWMLPIALVLLAGVVLAAAHFLFMRWMTRQPEQARDPDGRATDQTDARR
jgi:cell division protein FtsL